MKSRTDNPLPPTIARATRQVRTVTLAVVAILTAAALASCGGGSNESADTRRVVQIPISASEFLVTIEDSARREATKRGWKYELQIPKAPDVESQTATLNAVIASRPDVIFLEPVDAEGMVGPVSEAKSSGIKVLTYDSDITTTDARDAFIASDYVEGGREVARQLLEMTDGRGSFLHLMTWPGLAFSENLKKGYLEVMSEAPEAKSLPIHATAGEPSKADALVRAALGSTTDLSGAFLGTLPDQQGAESALRSANVLGSVKTVVWDANPQTIDQLNAGTWDAIVSTPAAEYGVRLVETAEAILNGDDFEAEQLLGTCVITADNVDSPEVEECIYLPLDAQKPE